MLQLSAVFLAVDRISQLFCPIWHRSNIHYNGVDDQFTMATIWAYIYIVFNITGRHGGKDQIAMATIGTWIQ